MGWGLLQGAFQAEELAGASNGVGEWRRRAAGGAVEPETPARSRGGLGPAWRWSPGLPFLCHTRARLRVRGTPRQGVGCELGAGEHLHEIGPLLRSASSPFRSLHESRVVITLIR